MSGANGSRFKEAQHLVLRAAQAQAVLHQVVRFQSPEGGRKFIEGVMKYLSPCFGIDRPKEAAGPQVSLGLTFCGLEALNLPDGYLHVFRRLSPPFVQGAPVRAARHLGDVGPSASGFWDAAFKLKDAHAVVTVYGTSAECVAALRRLKRVAAISRPKNATSKLCTRLVGAPMHGKHLDPPPGRQALGKTHWVHFGYRDGLTNPVVAGAGHTEGKPDVHEPGELLLGEVRDTGDNPWSLARLPEEVRTFFRHGSFGVLRHIEQHEQDFRTAVARWAKVLADDRGYRLASRAGDKAPVTWPADPVEEFVLAKLCGRWPDGQVVRPAHEPPHVPKGKPELVFDFNDDPHGAGCPFAAHLRRMNPRSGTGAGDDRVAHVRPRPLFRRGMPYGPWFDEKTKDAERGLLGLFFCADLADQFEHLLGEWVDRLPLGFPGDRHGKDPLIGAHDHPNASLLVPRRMPVDPNTGREPADPSPLALYGFRPFVQTRGTVYAFYPPRQALERLMSAQPAWTEEDDPWLV